MKSEHNRMKKNENRYKKNREMQKLKRKNREEAYIFFGQIPGKRGINDIV